MEEEDIETYKSFFGDTSGSWLSRNSVACELFIEKKKKQKCLLIRELDFFVKVL